MIYTLNTKDYVLYSVAKSTVEMPDNDVYEMINSEFAIMVSRLEEKGITYNQLKRALIPNQDKDNNEVCLVFDSSLIDSFDYGYDVFNKLLPLLDKNSTYSILAGDYIDIIRGFNNSQKHLFEVFKKSIVKCTDSIYLQSNQYYLIYINSITNNQLSSIISELKKVEYFYGYACLNSNSYFKIYLSDILCPVCIKSKNTIIVSHPIDYDDNENINMRGFPFTENGFKLVSINEDSFGPFLSYKIESFLPDEDDISFSYNALFPKFNSTNKLKLNLSDGKWGYLNDTSNGKGGIIKSLEFNNISKDDFVNIIFKQICGNYIYNLRVNEFNDRLFNVCIELPTKNGNIRKTTVALKYKPDCGEIDVVTMT